MPLLNEETVKSALVGAVMNYIVTELNLINRNPQNPHVQEPRPRQIVALFAGTIAFIIGNNNQNNKMIGLGIGVAIMAIINLIIMTHEINARNESPKLSF